MRFLYFLSITIALVTNTYAWPLPKRVDPGPISFNPEICNVAKLKKNGILSVYLLILTGNRSYAYTRFDCSSLGYETLLNIKDTGEICKYYSSSDNGLLLIYHNDYIKNAIVLDIYKASMSDKPRLVFSKSFGDNRLVDFILDEYANVVWLKVYDYDSDVDFYKINLDSFVAENDSNSINNKLGDIPMVITDNYYYYYIDNTIVAYDKNNGRTSKYYFGPNIYFDNFVVSSPGYAEIEFADRIISVNESGIIGSRRKSGDLLAYCGAQHNNLLSLYRHWDFAGNYYLYTYFNNPLVNNPYPIIRSKHRETYGAIIVRVNDSIGMRYSHRAIVPF